MPPVSKIPVVLAPALTADGALSMDLYLENLRAAFAPMADRFEFEVVVPATRPDEPWAAKQWKRYVAYPRLLARRLRARPGAVLHVLDHSYGHLCRADVPTVVTCHGLENFRLKLRRVWQQALWVYRVRAMRRARYVAAISGAVADDARRFADTPPAKIVLNHYGVDPVFTADGDAFPTLAARRAAGERLVLHVGTNYERKNVGHLLDALGQLRGQGLPVRLVKVGADPREDGYRTRLEQLGLDGHMDYLGWLDAPALAAVYRSCDVLAFPSIHEGFGRPIVEAQACGLPVVVADTASAREIAGTGACTHDAADAADFAAKLRAVLTDPTLHARLAADGAANIRRFSWAEHARVLTDLYARLHADR